MKTKQSLRIAALTAALILINLLSYRFFVRLDFTADKIYTLSSSTKNLLNDLSENVSITAYFTKELPPDIMNMRKDFRDLLVEYYQRSHGKMVFEFIDPSASALDEETAARAGIQPLVANIREKDQMKQQKIYLGVIVKCGEQTDVIPFITPGAGMEHALSTSIKKVSQKTKQTLGFSSGHGEAGPDVFPQLMQNLQVMYDAQTVTPSDSLLVPDKISTLVITAPTDSFSDAELSSLERYYQNGGNLILALNRVQGDFNTLSGNPVKTGLEKWLKTKGIILEEEFVIDAACSNIGITQQQGGFNFTSQVPFPFFPDIRNFEKHPVTASLESVVFQFTSPMTVNKNADFTFTPLLKSSDKSGLLKLPLTIDINREWTEADFTDAEFLLGGIFEPVETGGKAGKIILFSDGDFFVNGRGQDAHEVQPDNINLIMNAIDYLTDQSGLMELRTKEVTSRPLDELDDSRKAAIKYTNFLLPVILALAFGIYRYQRNRMIRAQRMEKTAIVTK
jgi:gliding-associated putative ABC transporter substrate-binding component GldG